MRMTFSLFLIFIFLNSFSQFEENDNRILTEFIVMLNPAHSIGGLQSEFRDVKIKKCLSPRMNIWLLERDADSTSEKFLFSLQQNSSIKLAQFNHRIKQRSLIPNDPDFAQQWNMLNTGQNGGIAGDDIDATDAWAINNDNVTANGDTVVVAIIDDLFDLNHEDLSYFINYNEIPGNGIDDDGNGYIDDVSGWNVFNNNGDVNSTGPGASHSTHVAGIAAAVGNNGKGIAGVCWGAKILPVAGSSTSEAEVVQAYDYVRTMRLIYNNTFGTKGAYVVSTNSSFGVDYGKPVDYPIWCAMYDSMGAVGILSAGATANLNINIDLQHDIPTECPSNYLIAVTNTMPNDTRNGSAAYGKINVDIGAPGFGIHSTIPPSSYGNMTGTSMATPHVAGAIAAMYAAACKSLIDKSYEQPDSVTLLIKEYLLDAAEWNSSLNNLTVSNGRLNLLRAILNLKKFNCDSCAYAVDVTKMPITCKGSSDGEVSLAFNTGSVSDYNVIWSNGLTFPEIQNLAPGFYSATITDTLTGCSRFVTSEFHNPDSISISSVTVNSSVNGNQGNVIVHAMAGNEILMYSLDEITYQQSDTLVIATNGNYTVYVKNYSGCVVQRSIFVSGLEDGVLNKQRFSIYPNPAEDALWVSYSFKKDLQLNLSIHNVVDEVIFTDSKRIAPGLHSDQVDISFLPNGIYFLQIEGSGEHVCKKFTIVH